MVESPPEYDYIDYTAIRFPSDRLDIGTMRRVHPDLFDVESAEFDEALAMIPDDEDGPAVGSILYLERMLAKNAFEEVRGFFTPSNHVADQEKPGFIDELTGYYMKYGLASGPEHAAQMIRDFESQAANQARGGGKSRG